MKAFQILSVCCLLSVPVSNAIADSTRALDILKTHCSSCHADGERQGGFGSATNLALLVSEKRIAPEDPLTSRIYQRMSDGSMPPDEEEPEGRKLNAAELRDFADWIRAGAPAEPTVVKEAIRPAIALSETWQAMRDYTLRQPKHQQKFIRFFSLRSAYNNPRRTNRELDVYRAGLGFVLNSLSWRREFVTLVPLSADRVVYAVNLNDVGWTPQTWEQILARYPYGLQHDQLPHDRVFNEVAEDVYRLCEEDVPVVRIDWAIATMTRPPLYDQLVNVPTQLATLEQRLGVDSARNILTRSVQRAGMNQSGVSEQHRLVERHSGTFGYYWKSYDFKPNGPRGDLRLFPLGPPSRSNPYPEFTFEHDGGEFIFQLPNGLQGYMLSTADGRRINGAAPSEIVSDTARLSGTVNIFNGISCMACHTQGMINCTDVVRAGTSVLGEARQIVEDLYPAKEVMDGYFKKDSHSFRNAAIAAMISTGVEESLVRQADGSVIAPVIPIVRFFQKQPLYAEDVASELGLPDTATLRVLIEHDERLAGLGFRTLLTDDGVITRTTLERQSASGRSVFQRAANYLKLGQPVAVGAR